MKITIVMGFFLPMPPVAGGAVEKSWHRLAHLFARGGHEVTLISRRWPGWPDDEIREGVRYLRLPGFSHTRWLCFNLLFDFVWSLRVHRHLPPADIVVLNTVSLACWLGRLRPGAGKVVAMPGRMPKGQFRLYRRLARILVPSSPVREAVIRENPPFASLTRVVGYPISWEALAAPRGPDAATLTIGYVGRIHREKGLHLLVAALRELQGMELPPWRVVICGPADIAQGGSGAAYLHSLREEVGPQVVFHTPVFDETALHALYRQFDLFCYPSLAVHGETFGVSVAEAMAAGAVPVVSDLPCFGDFLHPGRNGEVFDAHAPDAPRQLAGHLAALLRDAGRRHSLAAAAQGAVRHYDYTRFAGDLLTDFAQLTGTGEPASSPS